MRVHVTVTGIRQADGECERITHASMGQLTVTDGQAVVRYLERDEDGEQRLTVLHVDDEQVLMERPRLRQSLRLRRRRRCVCDYATPYGTLPLAITTHTLCNRLTADGGTLDISYTLELGGVTAEHTLHVDVQKNDT